MGFEIFKSFFRSSSTWRLNETNDENEKCFTLIPLLNYGICTPDSCTNYDVKKIFELGHFFLILKLMHLQDLCLGLEFERFNWKR